MKLIMEQWRSNVVNEGITDVVYHKTRLDQAMQIMQSNKFMTSVAFGTQADKDQNKGKLYYLSTMRSPTGDYGPGLPAVTFKLDGRKLGERSKAAAVDYWGPDFPKDEMEDRVFTDNPYMGPATKYITEIHVGLPIGDKYRQMRPARLEEAAALLAAANGASIPVFFYTNEKTYGILNKTKRLTLDQWKAAFKKSGSELDEPWGYKSSGPYIADALKGTVEVVKALESGRTEDIEKGNNSPWYKIKYDYGGEWGRRIETAVHNSKSEPEARDYISAVGKQLKKHGSLDAFVDWLSDEIKKSEGEQELKQVAERHGFSEELREVKVPESTRNINAKRKADDEATLRGDKGKFDQLMAKAVDATVGKIFKAYWTNRQKEKKKEAGNLKKKEQDKFDFADFEAKFEPDDAARQAASTFTKSEYQPPAEAIKTCMVQGQKYQEDPDNPSNKRCPPSAWEKIGQAVKEPEPSYRALNQQFKDDGVADDVKDIMAKPPKVVDKYEKIMKARAKNKAKKQANRDAYEKKIGKGVHKKATDASRMMEGWRRFVEETGEKK